MLMLHLFSLAEANWPDSACAEKPTQTDSCLAVCSWKDCPYDHWCSCGSCLPMSYCMTACTFVTCNSGSCCNCGYCSSTSYVAAASQATETDTTAQQATETDTTTLMSSGSNPWNCGEDCDSTNSFCFQDECYAIDGNDGCDGECDDVQDCDTCFCGFCVDGDNDYGTKETSTETLGSQVADSPKKPDTFLACLIVAAVILIGVIGLLVVRFLNKPGYKQFESSIPKTTVRVMTTETEFGTKRKKSDVYF